MASKGMSTTLVIIVAAVVILVTALVILTIFGNSLTPVVGIADAKAQCRSSADTACSLTGQLPATWNSPMYKISGVDALVPCSDSRICGAGSCTNNVFSGSC